jgi:hypothetical protein
MVRPSSRSATACIVSMEASGFVPASMLDDGSSNLWLGGGEREGSDCFPKSFREIFSTNTRVLCVISFFYGVFGNSLYYHHLLLM